MSGRGSSGRGSSGRGSSGRGSSGRGSSGRGSSGRGSSGRGSSGHGRKKPDTNEKTPCKFGDSCRDPSKCPYKHDTTFSSMVVSTSGKKGPKLKKDPFDSITKFVRGFLKPTIANENFSLFKRDEMKKVLGDSYIVLLIFLWTWCLSEKSDDYLSWIDFKTFAEKEKDKPSPKMKLDISTFGFGAVFKKEFKNILLESFPAGLKSDLIQLIWKTKSPDKDGNIKITCSEFYKVDKLFSDAKTLDTWGILCSAME